MILTSLISIDEELKSTGIGSARLQKIKKKLYLDLNTVIALEETQFETETIIELNTGRRYRIEKDIITLRNLVEKLESPASFHQSIDKE